MPRFEQLNLAMPTVKLAVLNLANYDDHPLWPQRRAIIVDELARRKPHAVLLQEVCFDPQRASTRSSGLDMASQLAVDLGMYCSLAIAQYYDPASCKPVDGVTCVWEGLATLTRCQPRLNSALALDTSAVSSSSDGNRRIVQRVDFDDLSVFNTHLSTDPLKGHHEAAVMLEWMEQAPTGHRLCGGDFNAVPSQISSLLDAAGLIDAWQATHDNRQTGYTFPSNDPTERIDYLWLDKELSQRIVCCQRMFSEAIGQIYASDHLGLWLELG